LLLKIFIGLGAALLLLVGSAVVVPSFIDWNAQFPEIAAQVKSATGRDLTIDGKLEVRILPTPMVTAHGVKLGNIQGGTAPHMVVLDAVEVRVALMPLLAGRLQVERIRLVRPTIILEKLKDGRTNLDFQGTVQAPAGPSTPAKDGSKGRQSAGGLDVRLDNFEIKNATLIYLDGQTGRKERVEGLDATLRASSLQGPFEAQGQARVHGMPVSFEVSLGKIIAERTVPVNANINISGGTQMQISGAVLGLGAEPHFKGKVKVTGDNLAQLLDAARGTKTTPTLLARTFALDSLVQASATAVDLSELHLQFATTRVTGHVGLNLTTGLAFDVKLKAARIDVDDLLGARSGRALSPSSRSRGGAMAPAPPTNGADVGADAGFSFPTGVSGTVQLTVDAVTLKGGLISDVRLNAELADGELALNQFQLMAPGVTDMALFGFVRAINGQPKFDGSLDVLTSDPKGLANWLNVKVPDGVANRLKRVTFTTKIFADTEQVALSGLRVTGDRSTVTGGITVALRARPSFGADLNLDTLDLDTYSKGADAPAAMASSAPSSPAQALDVSATALEAWAALNALNTFDANMKVHVGSLKVKGRTYKNLRVDGTLYAGTLNLRTLSLGDFHGAKVKVSGSLNGFGGVPEMTNVKIHASVKNAAALARDLGLAGVPKSLTKVSLNCEVEGSLIQPHLTLNIKALDGAFATQGRFSLLPIGFGYDGTFSAKHPDAVRLLTALDLGFTPKGPLGALDLRGKIKSDGKTYTVTDMQGGLGQTSMSGDLRVALGGQKPRVSADLKTGLLKMDAFLPRPRPGRAKRAQRLMPHVILAAYKDQNAVEMARTSRAAKRWSREVFDLAALNQVNGELTLQSQGIQFGDYRLDNADIHATVQAGVMTVDRVKGNLFDGPVNGSAVVRADGQPTLRGHIALNALDVARAVKTIAGKDLAGGKLNLNVDFKASGLSPAALVSSLGGQGNVRIGGLDVKQNGSGTALAGVIGLVSSMNALGGGSGAALADVSLSFDLQDGVARSSDFRLTSSLGSGSGAGSIDLAAWQIDFTGAMTVEANLLTTLLSKGRIGRQEIPFMLTGTLDKPGVKLGIKPARAKAASSRVDPLQQMMQQFLPGAARQPASQSTPQDGTLAPPPPQQGSQTPPAQRRTLTPEEMIKQLMRGM